MTTMCDHHICIFGKSILQFCVASVTHSNWAKVFGFFLIFSWRNFLRCFYFICFSLCSAEKQNGKNKKKISGLGFDERKRANFSNLLEVQKQKRSLLQQTFHKMMEFPPTTRTRSGDRRHMNRLTLSTQLFLDRMQTEEEKSHVCIASIEKLCRR